MGDVLAGLGKHSFQNYKYKEDVQSLAVSQNNFAKDMYVKLAKEGNGNLFFSPLCIVSALSMTLAGARGNTKDQMQKVLHLNPKDAVHDAFSDVIADIKNKVPEYELEIANMVYVSDQFKVLNEFAELLAEKYKSTSKTVDFDKEAEVRTEINRAVENATNSRIKDVIPQGMLDSMTRMVLVNAVYFKGLWQHQFNETATYDDDFWISATSSVKVPMMHIKKKFEYRVRDDLNAKILKMNYQGSRMSMVIVLPRARDGLATLEDRLTNINFNELDKNMFIREVEVILPKFKLEESLDLGSHLATMGMVDLFSDKDADLSGISGNRDLYVSKVLHKAFVEVNEKGSEAAAATVVGIRLKSARMSPPPETFIVDHPSMFFIQDCQSGLVHFLGRLTNVL